MVIEVATFTLASGITPEAFRPLDQAVEDEHVSRQPGFISRQSAASEDGEWLVIVHWRSVEDAEASMASFASAPAAEAFMAHLQADTMQMNHYSTE
ncbi:MAG: antibiotic biosynthesis monooxygenase [Bacteroidota bacterium]